MGKPIGKSFGRMIGESIGMSIGESPGYSWRELQDVLREASTRDEVLEILAKEKSGKNRRAWVDRIAGRYKELRRLDEKSASAWGNHK